MCWGGGGGGVGGSGKVQGLNKERKVVDWSRKGRTREKVSGIMC